MLTLLPDVEEGMDGLEMGGRKRKSGSELPDLLKKRPRAPSAAPGTPTAKSLRGPKSTRK